MRKNLRQQQIDSLRRQQQSRDNDWFFDQFDQTLNSGAKGFFKLGAIAIILNLLFWAAIIAMVVFGLSFIL